MLSSLTFGSCDWKGRLTVPADHNSASGDVRSLLGKVRKQTNAQNFRSVRTLSSRTPKSLASRCSTYSSQFPGSYEREILLPKTYLTREGHLVLFAVVDNELFALVNDPYQPLQFEPPEKERETPEPLGNLGSIEDFVLSVLEYKHEKRKKVKSARFASTKETSFIHDARISGGHDKFWPRSVKGDRVHNVTPKSKTSTVEEYGGEQAGIRSQGRNSLTRKWDTQTFNADDDCIDVPPLSQYLPSEGNDASEEAIPDSTSVNSVSVRTVWETYRQSESMKSLHGKLSSSPVSGNQIEVSIPTSEYRVEKESTAASRSEFQATESKKEDENHAGSLDNLALDPEFGKNVGSSQLPQTTEPLQTAETGRLGQCHDVSKENLTEPNKRTGNTQGVSTVISNQRPQEQPENFLSSISPFMFDSSKMRKEARAKTASNDDKAFGFPSIERARSALDVKVLQDFKLNPRITGSRPLPALRALGTTPDGRKNAFGSSAVDSILPGTFIQGKGIFTPVLPPLEKDSPRSGRKLRMHVNDRSLTNSDPKSNENRVIGTAFPYEEYLLNHVNVAGFSARNNDKIAVQTDDAIVSEMNNLFDNDPLASMKRSVTWHEKSKLDARSSYLSKPGFKSAPLSVNSSGQQVAETKDLSLKGDYVDDDNDALPDSLLDDQDIEEEDGDADGDKILFSYIRSNFSRTSWNPELSFVSVDNFDDDSIEIDGISVDEMIDEVVSENEADDVYSSSSFPNQEQVGSPRSLSRQSASPKLLSTSPQSLRADLSIVDGFYENEDPRHSSATSFSDCKQIKSSSGARSRSSAKLESEPRNAATPCMPESANNSPPFLFDGHSLVRSSSRMSKSSATSTIGGLVDSSQTVLSSAPVFKSSSSPVIDNNTNIHDPPRPGSRISMSSSLVDDSILSLERSNTLNSLARTNSDLISNPSIVSEKRTLQEPTNNTDTFNSTIASNGDNFQELSRSPTWMQSPVSSADPVSSPPERPSLHRNFSAATNISIRDSEADLDAVLGEEEKLGIIDEVAREVNDTESESEWPHLENQSGELKVHNHTIQQPSSNQGENKLLDTDISGSKEQISESVSNGDQIIIPSGKPVDFIKLQVTNSKDYASAKINDLQTATLPRSQITTENQNRDTAETFHSDISKVGREEYGEGSQSILQHRNVEESLSSGDSTNQSKDNSGFALSRSFESKPENSPSKDRLISSDLKIDFKSKDSQPPATNIVSEERRLEILEELKSSREKPRPTKSGKNFKLEGIGKESGEADDSAELNEIKMLLENNKRKTDTNKSKTPKQVKRRPKAKKEVTKPDAKQKGKGVKARKGEIPSQISTAAEDKFSSAQYDASSSVAPDSNQESKAGKTEMQNPSTELVYVQDEKPLVTQDEKPALTPEPKMLDRMSGIKTVVSGAGASETPPEEKRPKVSPKKVVMNTVEVKKVVDIKPEKVGAYSPSKVKKGSAGPKKSILKKKDIDEQRKKAEQEELERQEQLLLLREKELEQAKAREAALERQRLLEEEKVRRVEEEEQAKQLEAEAREKLRSARARAREEKEAKRAAEAERRRLEVEKRREERRLKELELQEKEKEMERMKYEKEKRAAELREERQRLAELARMEEERIKEQEQIEALQREEEERRLEEERIRKAEEDLERLIEERELREQMRRIAEAQQAKLREEELLRQKEEDEERKRIEEERNRLEFLEQQRMQEELERQKEAERLRIEALEKARREAARKRAMLLERRQANINRMSDLKFKRKSQGITRAFTFTYFVHIPKSVWEVPIGWNNKNTKKKK